MKKLSAICITLALVIVSLVVFVACGGGESWIVSPDKDVYTVGICQLVQHEALDLATKGFKDALQKIAAEKGKKVVFDEQNASGETTNCTTIINGFVSKKVDLIMANATSSLQTAYNATQKIPVLGTSVTDYATALGLTDFDGTTGTNVSGTTDLAPLDKQAEMIHVLCPSAKKVAILYCSAESNSKYQADVVGDKLKEWNVEAKSYPFSDSNDIAAAANKAVSECDVLYVPTDNTVASSGSIVSTIAEQAGKPVFCGEESTCKKVGGMATLTISYYNIGRITGEMAAKVLFESADVSKMQVQSDINPVYKYNEELATRYNITVPDNYVKMTADSN